MRRPRSKLTGPTLPDLRSLSPGNRPASGSEASSGSRCQSLRDLQALPPHRQPRLPLRPLLLHLQDLLQDSQLRTSVCLLLLLHSQPRLGARTRCMHLQALLPQRHLRLSKQHLQVVEFLTLLDSRSPCQVLLQHLHRASRKPQCPSEPWPRQPRPSTGPRTLVMITS